jgi:hypothetical protein
VTFSRLAIALPPRVSDFCEAACAVTSCRLGCGSVESYFLFIRTAKLPSWIGGVSAASADGVVEKKNQIFADPPPRLAKPRHPSYPGGEPFVSISSPVHSLFFECGMSN